MELEAAIARVSLVPYIGALMKKPLDLTQIEEFLEQG